MKQPFPKERAIKLLHDCIDEIDSVQKAPAFGEVFLHWRSMVFSTIRHVFGDDSNHIGEFDSVGYKLRFRSSGTSNTTIHNRYLQGLDQARGVLKAMVSEVEKFWSDETTSELEAHDAIHSRKVFLVHGRDIAAQQSVARFLEKLGLEPVILAECPNSGRTIIEKFEQESNVDYAIALFTPDDSGGLRDGDEEQLRARQNVIFELGYFVGRRGRSRVCVLNVPEVEIPSDLFGVAYVQFAASSEGWKIGLVKELKAAGFDIDANKAFS